MVDNQNLQQVREATGAVVTSLHDTNQRAVDILTTMQDRSLQFAQTTYINWMELLTQQIESTQQLQQQWEQQIQRQQEALLKLTFSSVQTYMDFFFVPFSFMRRGINATEEAMQREREHIA
jgi:predicted PurR-regulated permease PerM